MNYLATILDNTAILPFLATSTDPLVSDLALFGLWPVVLTSIALSS